MEQLSNVWLIFVFVALGGIIFVLSVLVFYKDRIIKRLVDEQIADFVQRINNGTLHFFAFHDDQFLIDEHGVPVKAFDKMVGFSNYVLEYKNTKCDFLPPTPGAKMYYSIGVEGYRYEKKHFFSRERLIVEICPAQRYKCMWKVTAFNKDSITCQHPIIGTIVMLDQDYHRVLLNEEALVEQRSLMLDDGSYRLSFRIA